MDEKVMVNDILSNTKASLSDYQTSITECANVQLRQALQQIRNECESFQYELFKVAQSKNYYQPAEQADSAKIQNVKNQFQQ